MQVSNGASALTRSPVKVLVKAKLTWQRASSGSSATA